MDVESLYWSQAHLAWLAVIVTAWMYRAGQSCAEKYSGELWIYSTILHPVSPSPWLGNERMYRKLAWFLFYYCYSWGWQFIHPSRGLHALNFLLVPKEGELGISYHFAQSWGTARRMRREAWKLTANNGGKKSFTYYCNYPPIRIATILQVAVENVSSNAENSPLVYIYL